MTTAAQAEETLNPLPWEAASTPDIPWPCGWFVVPARKRFRCVFDGHILSPGKYFWSTGVEGECFCQIHAPFAPKLVLVPEKKSA